MNEDPSKTNEVFEDLSQRLVEYVRAGMYKEAHYLVKYDFEN